jgi:hypothetical protein
VYRVSFLLVILLFLNGCSNNSADDIELDYGVPYFEVDCVWVSPTVDNRLALWRCYEIVETPLLSGFLFLELEHAESLYFCGEDLVLTSGIETYDNLIAFLTRNKYNCLHITEDTKKGNALDWSWEADINRLQIIWRPEEQSHKMITMIIEDADYNVVVRTIVYYKIILEY